MTMTESGKKVTTVISCTTFETVKVSDPIVYYEADRAHIIYMSRDNVRGKFYEDLVSQIKEQVSSKRKVEFFEHNSMVHKYGDMLKIVNDIIKQEKDEFGQFVDIFVNISSGSAEYAAAAMCACMMNAGVIPFTVKVTEHNIPLEKFRELIGEDAPFGDAKAVDKPKMVETFNLESPKEELISYLAFFASIENEPHTNTSIARMMAEADVWRYSSKDGKEKAKQASAMQFRRTVLEPLLEKGWIMKGSTPNRWVITPSGRAILDIFCDEEEIRSYREIVDSMRMYRTRVCNSMKLMLDNDE